MIFVITVVVLMASTVIYKKIRNHRYYKLLSRIPSPPRSRIPFAGNLALLTNELKKLGPGAKPGEAYFKFEQQLAKEFGKDGIVAVDFELVARTWVYIMKPDMYRTILTDNDNIRKSAFYFLATDYLGQENLLFADGQSWKTARKIITPAFHYSILDQFTSTFNSCADNMCLELEQKSNVADLYKIISHHLMKSLVETSLGLHISGDMVDDYLKHFEVYNVCYSKRITNPFLVNDWIFGMTQTGKDRSEALNYLHKFTSDAIKSRMEVLDSDVTTKKRCCLADTLIREHIKNPTLFTMDYIRNQLDTFTFAGHDTTSNTLTNTLYLIALHPHVQEKLHEELDMNLSVDEIDDVTTDTFNRLKYLDAVLKESQRYFPAVSSLGREVTKEVSIGGYTLPVGCYIIFNLYSLNRDPDQYSNPEKFIPERFLPESEENGKRHPFSFIPFSAGPRNCIGQKFAINELKVFLIKLLSRFKISTSLKEEDIRLCQGLTLTFANKVDMKFQLRM